MSDVQTAAPKVHEKYMQRLKARLARPVIGVDEARDGMLDCFVSTYFEGVSHGLRGVLGVTSGPDDVARVAAGMFRTRLAKHGASFESPTIDALSKVKDEVDTELHFNELPAEMQGMHDQVCSLLLSKAEGTLAHEGDRSAVKPTPAPAPAVRPATPVARASRTSAVSMGLRSAVRAYLDEFALAVDAGEDTAALAARSKRLDKLLGALAEFE